MRPPLPSSVKGTVSRDFLLLVFYDSPPAPEYSIRAVSNFFKNSRRYSQGALPVSTTPAANLPPVSMTPAANFATIFASVVDTGGKFATGVIDTSGKKCEQYQVADTLK
jgi:hypothetical protein